MEAPVIVVKCNSKPTSAEDKCNESRPKHGRLRISLVKLIPRSEEDFHSALCLICQDPESSEELWRPRDWQLPEMLL